MIDVVGVVVPELSLDAREGQVVGDKVADAHNLDEAEQGHKRSEDIERGQAIVLVGVALGDQILGEAGVTYWLK